jgi:hypothetical protein
VVGFLLKAVGFIFLVIGAIAFITLGLIVLVVESNNSSYAWYSDWNEIFQISQILIVCIAPVAVGLGLIKLGKSVPNYDANASALGSQDSNGPR